MLESYLINNCATGSLVLYVCFVDRFVLLYFFFWPLCCLSFHLRILITPLVSCGHCIVCPLIYGFWLPLWYLRFTASDYPFGILWPLYCLSFDLWLLITPLVSCGHCIVCLLIYGFSLPLWYLQTFLNRYSKNNKRPYIYKWFFFCPLQKQCHSMKARLAEVQTKEKVDYLRNLLSKLTGGNHT